MAGRVNFGLWNEQKKYWVNAQCKTELAEGLALQFVKGGFTVRVNGLVYQPVQQAKAA